jgi:hypothetical protein
MALRRSPSYGGHGTKLHEREEKKLELGRFPFMIFMVDWIYLCVSAPLREKKFSHKKHKRHKKGKEGEGR